MSFTAPDFIDYLIDAAATLGMNVPMIPDPQGGEGDTIVDLPAFAELVCKRLEAAVQTTDTVQPKKIVIAVYEHRHGSDMRAFTTMEAAEKWKNEIADEWWENELSEDRPENPEELGDAYFQVLRECNDNNEFFAAEWTDLET